MSFASLPYAELLRKIQERTPTPGGGTAAALAGAMGAALLNMALRFTLGRKSTEPQVAEVLEVLDPSLLAAGQKLLALADADAESYEKVRSARKLPATTEAEQTHRAQVLHAAVLGAAETPLRTAKLCRDCLEMVAGVLHKLNPNLATDAAAGADLLKSGATSACLNVEVNLKDLPDPEAVARLIKDCSAVLERTGALEGRVRAWAQEVLKKHS